MLCDVEERIFLAREFINRIAIWLLAMFCNAIQRMLLEPTSQFCCVCKTFRTSKKTVAKYILKSFLNKCFIAFSLRHLITPKNRLFLVSLYTHSKAPSCCTIENVACLNLFVRYVAYGFYKLVQRTSMRWRCERVSNFVLFNYNLE